MTTQLGAPAKQHNRSSRWFFSCACCSSRRQFMAGAATLGATALLPGTETPALAAPAKLIDTHHHFYPPAYQKAWADWEDQRKIPHLGVQLAWTREQDIEAMDKNGITTSVLSLPSTPGVWFVAAPRRRARYGAALLRFRRGDGARQTRPLWSVERN